MNRLFGVRNPGAIELGAAFGDQGRRGEMLRSAVGEARRPTVRSSSRGQGLSWSAGPHAGREASDDGTFGGHHHHHHRRRHNHTQRPSGEPVLQAATRQQENIPVAGGEATWSHRANVPPPPPPALKLGEEHTRRHAQIRPSLGAAPTLSSSPPPPAVAADARQGEPCNAAPASVTGRRTPALSATPCECPGFKDKEDAAGGAGEGRRSETPPPPPSPSAEPPLATDNLDLTGVSTRGSHATDTSAAGAPASSVSRAARSPVVVAGVGHDAIVPRQSAAVAQPESAALLEERALEVSEPPALGLLVVVCCCCGRCLALILLPPPASSEASMRLAWGGCSHCCPDVV